MKLTRLEAIEQHRDMWNRIYKYCNERYDSKTVPNAKKIKRTILREMNGGEWHRILTAGGISKTAV